MDFDGQNFTVSGLYIDDNSLENAGLFATNDYYTIRNLKLNNGYVHGGSRTGALVGSNTGSVVNCHSSVTVMGEGIVGGLVGSSNGGEITGCSNTGNVEIVGNVSSATGGIVGYASGTVIRNCYNLGAVDGDLYVGGIAGKCDSTVENCFNAGSLYSKNETVAYIAHNAEVRNSYYLANEETTDGGRTEAQLESGEVAYLLQSGVSEEDIYDDDGNYVETVIPEIWGQTIGTEDYPVLGGETVYKVTGCDGESVAYSNTNADKTHSYVNGFCSACDCYQPAVLNDGVYEISNAGQLYWFAQQVNSGNHAINGKLMANIVVNEGVITAESTDVRAWTPIGSYDIQYTGTFEGNNKTVSGLYFNDDEREYVGLFGYLGTGGTIQNVGIVNFYFCGYECVGSVVGFSCAAVNNCYSTGNVNGSGHNIGGVVGYNCGEVANCYNTGSVSSGSWYVGGVVGCNMSGTVTNCYNTGSVAGKFEVGGVAGQNTGTVRNYYSTGNVDGNGDVGGVVGYNTRTGTTTNGYFNSDDYSGNAIGENSGTATNVEGKTTAQFKSGEVASLLGAPFGQNIDNGSENEGSPVFSDAAVYKVIGRDGESDAYSNKNEPLQHNYVDGTCTVCAAEEPKDPAVTASQATLMLEDEVSINIYFIVANLNVGTENMGLLAWNTEPEDPSYENADHRYADVSTCGERFKVSTDPIAAKNMGDTKYYMVYAQAEDGTYYYSHVFPYSPKMYAMSRLEDSTDEGLKKLCVALLNYGAEAQKYFASTTDYEYTELMNADLTDEQKAYVEAYREDMVPAVVPAEDSKVGSFAATANSFTSKKATVTLGGALTVNFYMVPSNTTDSMTLY